MFNEDGSVKDIASLQLTDEGRAAIATLGQALLDASLEAGDAGERQALMDGGIALMRHVEGKKVHQVLEAGVPIASLSPLTLPTEQIVPLYRQSVDSEYRDRAKESVGDDVWQRLSKDQQVALTDIAYNYWGFGPFDRKKVDGKRQDSPLRTAIIEDLLRDPVDEACPWRSTVALMQAKAPGNVGSRFQKSAELFSGCTINLE